MLESQDKLVFVIDEVVHFSEDPPPFLVRTWQNSENWFQPLAVQFCLVVQIFESESELLTLRHAFYTKIEPRFISVFLIGRTIVTDPKEVFIFLELGDFREIASTEI